MLDVYFTTCRTSVPLCLLMETNRTPRRLASAIRWIRFHFIQVIGLNSKQPLPDLRQILTDETFSLPKSRLAFTYVCNNAAWDYMAGAGRPVDAMDDSTSLSLSISVER